MISLKGARSGERLMKSERQKEIGFWWDRELSQYVWLSSPDEAYQEDAIPAHSDIRRKEILYWDLIPLWKLRNKYTRQEKIYNSEAEELLPDYQSPRQQRMVRYLQSRKPKWGRNVVETIDDMWIIVIGHFRKWRFRII